MGFRFKAFGAHLAVSVLVLTTLLGGLYVGWYRWPGWYLAGAVDVIRILASVDLVIGPLLTFVIASPTKPRRALARDVAMIGVVQLAALLYGGTQLWNGRPLYYAFSLDELQVVQAYDIEADEGALARRQNSPWAPHWYSLPRWIWAPLPDDPQLKDKIVESAVSGGSDVIAMPRYYQAWTSGLSELRSQLQKVGDIKYFSGNEKQALKAKVRAAGINPDEANSLAFSGRGRPLLAVFNLSTLQIKAILKLD